MLRKKIDIALGIMQKRKDTQIVKSTEDTLSKDEVIYFHCPSRYELAEYNGNDCCRGSSNEVCAACWNEEIEVEEENV